MENTGNTEYYKYQLCYILKIGIDGERKNIFDLFFTDNIIDVNDDDYSSWEESPAYNSDIPSHRYIAMKCRIATDMDMYCLTDEDDEEITYHFSMYDACDGVIPLAWEKVGDENYGRYVFKFGLDYLEIYENLKNRGITIETLK